MSASMLFRLLPIAASAAFAGCASAPPVMSVPVSPSPSTANAMVIVTPASGSLVSGKLQLLPMGDGVHLRGELGGLTRNARHGIHVHERGDCSAVDAASAGAHFNPTGKPHGRMRTGTHHLGDMDNLAANNDGVARVDMHVPGLALANGSSNDIIGRAIVVHAGADDYSTQPSGNSGSRVACGVIVRAR